MSRSRFAATVAAIFALALGAAPAAQALTITTGTIQITASAPILGDVVGGLQTLVSGVVGATTKAACEVTNNDTVCTLQILSYGIATDYKRPNGTHYTKVTGGVVNLPTLIDASGDGLPDIAVQIVAVSTSNIKMYIQRQLTAPANFPLSVEALVNDPSTPNRIINVGYDTRNSTAPLKWTAEASLTTGTTTTVNAKLSVEGQPSTMSVIGGLYTQGPGGTRTNPKQARLTFTPVPTVSNLSFSLAPASTSGTVSTISKTKADLELLMLDGLSGTHVFGTLDKLNLPVNFLMNKVDGNGVQTDGTTGNTHVRLNTLNDVDKANLLLETITNSQIMQRVKLNTTKLPGQTDFTQTPNGFLVDTDVPIALVNGGVAAGVPAVGNTPAIPVPANSPVESNEPSYVHQDTTGQIDSTTFRVAGVQHVSVESTGPQENRKIAIGARLLSAPMHVLLTNDKAPGGTKYDADINNVPHNVSLAIAPGQTRMVDFCGSTTDAADPCSAAGQASPAGIANITLNPSYAPAPIFGRATHLEGKIEGIPSTLGIDVETHAPADDNDPNQNTRVYIDATRPIGKTVLRASDGSPLPADPTDNGLVYTDTPAKYVVIAKVDGFRRAHLDTKPKLALELNAAGGHDFSYDVNIPPRHIDGSLPNRPAGTKVSLDTPDGAPTVLKLDGADENGVAVPTPQLLMNLDQTDPIFGEATHLDTNFTGIPTHMTLTIDSRSPVDDNDPDQNTKVHVDANSRIGHILLHATDGSAPPADPADNGLVYVDKGGKFAVVARVDGFRHADLDTEPVLDLDLFTDGGHDFSYLIDMDDRHIDGSMADKPAQTGVTFGGTPTTLSVAGHTAGGAPAFHPSVVLNMNQADPLFSRADHIQANVQSVPPSLDMVIDTHTPVDDNDPDQNTKVHIDSSAPVGSALIRASDGGPLPADPADNGVVYQDQANKTFAIIAKVDGFEMAHLDTKPKLKVEFKAESGHDFTYGIHLPADDPKPESDFTGLLENRPKTTSFFFDKPDNGPMEVKVRNFDDNDNPTGIDEITLNAANLSDDPAETLHNVKVDLVDVPNVLDLVKAPGEDTDVTVSTSGGPVGSADVVLDNGKDAPTLGKPTIAANGGGVIVFLSPEGTAPEDKLFYLHAHVLGLQGVHLATKPKLVANLDIAQAQDFQVYINNGVGKNYKDPANSECQDDFDAANHVKAHEEYHDVFIKNMQPNTHFTFETGDDGNSDACERKTWRVIDYSAAGRADSVTYNSTAGDMAHLKTVIGQEGSNPLKVPEHLQVCQAGYDKCYQKIGKVLSCNGTNCDSSDADQTVYLSGYGQKTHISLNMCSTNDDPDNFATCVRDHARHGVFVKLNFTWVDMGFAYDTGFGFFSMNTRDGALHQANGFVRTVDDGDAARFVNLNFGYDHNGGPDYSAASSTWDQYAVIIAFALPLVGSSTGDEECIDSSSGPSYDDWNDYFHVIIDPAEILGQDDLGDMLTSILC